MITVEHLTEVSARLTEAGVVKVPTAVRKVTVEGAKVLRASIKDNATFPTSKTGNLKRSVRYKASRGFKGERYTVGAFGKGSAHRGLVIYGHRIRGHARQLGSTRLSTRVFGHRATGGSGYTRPNPFIEEGASRGEAAAVTALMAAASAAIKAATT